MQKLLAVFIAALVLAYFSEMNTKAIVASGRHYSAGKDWAYILLNIVLILFSGLRINYNDTYNYIYGFELAPGLSDFFADAENLNIFKNPLFYFFQSALKTLGMDAQILIFLSSIFTQISLLRFFKRYAEHFTFSIFLFFCLGTYVFTLAAIKQVLAMSILALAFPFLEKRNWVAYLLAVFIASMFHTYAIIFAALPFFLTRPWRTFTFLFVLILVVVMMNFEEAITAFMEQANDLGKTLTESEVFHDSTINIFRLSVYAIPPLISFCFQKWIFRKNSSMEHILAHMSIISFAFMCMGTQSGANMFGRMANYFELGTICYLPTMLKRTFDKRSYRLVASVACVCFVGFFVYANAINNSFDQEYRAITLWEFLLSLM